MTDFPEARQLLRRYERQIGRRQAALETLVATVGTQVETTFTPQTTKSLERRQRTTREAIEALMRQRGAVEALVNIEDQMGVIRKFGWQVARDIPRNPAFADTLGPTPTEDDVRLLRHKIWQKIPDCRFKRCSELFVEEENFAFPPCALDQRGNVRFAGSTNWDRVSTNFCLISIDRVPDDLVLSLGLCEEPPESVDRAVTWLQRKRDAIPTLKMIIEAAEAVEGHERLLFLRAPADDIRRRRPEAPPIPAKTLGTYLAIRTIPTAAYIPPSRRGRKPAAPRRLSAQHFRSVYDAERSVQHIDATYRRELAMLADLCVQIEREIDDLNAIWTTLDQEGKKSLTQTMKERIDAWSATLEGCTHPFKGEALAMLRQASDELASQGRCPQTSVVLGKLLGGLHRLLDRKRETKEKHRTRFGDGDSLHDRIAQEESTIDRVRESIVRNEALILQATPLTTDQKRLLLMELNPDQLLKVQSRPLKDFAELLAPELKRLCTAIWMGMPREALPHAVAAHVYGKGFEARRVIERVNGFLVNRDAVPAQALQHFHEGLTELLLRREIAPDFTHPRLDAPYRRLLEELEAVGALIAPLVREERTLEERSEQYETLKAALDRLSPEEILAAP